MDQPPNDDNYTAELFTMVRDNGRIVNDFKCVVGGTDILEADFQLKKIFTNPAEEATQVLLTSIFCFRGKFPISSQMITLAPDDN